jgi:putative ABC transport system permease protein
VTPIGILFGLVYGGVAWAAFRRPLLGRLAVRSIRRRPGQSVLVVAGLMIGSAAITASLIGADSTEESSVLNAYRGWGMIDYTVTAPNNVTFAPNVAARLAADEALAAGTDGVAAGIDQVAAVADLETRQSESGQVALVGFDPAAQRPFGAYLLTDGGSTFGDDLGPNDVLLSRKLAANLGARAGDRIRVTVETTKRVGPVDLVVRGIARAEGPGAYTLAQVVFAPLSTAQRVVGTTEINVVRVSATGGLRPARSAFPELRAAVARLALSGLEARDSKRAEVDEKRKGTEFIKTFLVAMSVLVMAAGAALVVNLISMLAEERRTQLGILRALGITRRRLVTLSIIEGAVYSLAAAAVGTGAGILAGRVIAGRFAKAFAEFTSGRFDFRFVFSLKGETVAVAFGLGAVLTLVVVFITSRRTSRMSIPAAIRNLPEPAKERHRGVLRRVLVSVLGAAGLLGVAAGKDFARLAAGIALIAALASITRRRVPARPHTTLAGLALALWCLGNVAVQDPNQDAGTFFPIFVVSLLATVFGLSIVAVANLRIAEWFFGLLGRAFTGLRAMLRPPLAYMARRGTRTGLTTGVFALILAMLQLFAVFQFIFRPDYARAAGGYDVRLLSTGSGTVAIPPELRADVARFTSIPTRGYVGPFRSPDSFGNGGDAAFIPMYEVDPSFAERAPLKLDGKLKGFDSEREAWRAVLGDPAAVAAAGRKALDCPKDPSTGAAPRKGQPRVRASGFVLMNFGSVGQCLTVRGAQGTVTFMIAGIQTFGVLDGLFASKETLEPFRGLPTGASVMIEVRPGAGAAALARRLESALFAQGVDATTTRALLDDAYKANRTFFSVIDLLMKMGLIVGILALGIVALRAIIERRHVIGVLRALGYQRWQVMSGLMTEAATTTFVGVVVGMATGVTMGYIFYRQFDTNVPFGVEWPSILGAVGAVFVAVILVTLGPAWRASRLPPAEAVRYSE